MKKTTKWVSGGFFIGLIVGAGFAAAARAFVASSTPADPTNGFANAFGNALGGFFGGGQS